MNRRSLLLAVTAVLLSGAVVFAQFSRDFQGEFLENPTGQSIIQAFGALKSGYLNDVTDDAVLQGALNGMMEALEDPFAYYRNPKDTAREMDDLSGSFEGIGVSLTTRNRATGKGVEVLTVFQGGPASQAGLQRGDIFMEVDGVDVSEATSLELVDLVRGPQGTVVELTMQRPGSDELIEFAVTRGTIEIVEVSSTMLDDSVGYLNIRSFGNQLLYDQLLEQLASLEEQGATSLVLDLRDNPGGLLSQGVLVADEFLSEGDIVFQRSRGVTQRYAAADPHSIDLPMVVLVNEHSASASEIVAGALQENGRALVIGEQTFGKGVAQSVLSLSDGGQLIYPSFEWLTPDRRSIADEGVTPDVFAEDTRYPDVVSVEGQGATSGQTVELVIDGEVVGTGTVAEDGTFDFVSVAGERPETSSVQGQAIVDIATDTALQTAIQVVLEQVQLARN